MIEKIQSLWFNKVTSKNEQIFRTLKKDIGTGD